MNEINIDVKLYSDSLIKDVNGIFFSEHQSAISYPEDGNSQCFALEDNSYWFNHRNDCIVALVKNYAQDAVFFDIGGGNGYVATGLANAGIATCLIEPGLQGCINAKSRGLPNIICSTLDGAEFKPDSLPSAGLFDVVEHVRNDASFLQSVNRYQATGERLFITVPAYNFLWSNEDVAAGHFRRYTLEYLKKSVIAAGYTVEYASYLFSFLVIPIFLFRVLPSKILRNDNLAKNRHKSEHFVNGGGSKMLIKIVINSIRAIELALVKRHWKIPFGSSCLIVAIKHNNFKQK